MGMPHSPVLRSIAIVLLAFLIQTGLARAEPSDATKLQLKASILEHIKQHTDGGTYYFIDNDSTDLLELSFLAMHPVVFERSDGTYALCADFADASGNKVLVDYFVREIGGNYVVLSSVAGKRSILMSIAERFSL